LLSPRDSRMPGTLWSNSAAAPRLSSERPAPTTNHLLADLVARGARSVLTSRSCGLSNPRASLPRPTHYVFGHFPGLLFLLRDDRHRRESHCTMSLAVRGRIACCMLCRRQRLRGSLPDAEIPANVREPYAEIPANVRVPYGGSQQKKAMLRASSITEVLQ